MSTEAAMSAEAEQAATLARLIRESSPVVALTGAGISVPSGIPDFRSPGTGLWARVDPMEVAHIDAFRRDPERFWQFYGERFQTLDGKQPNPAHDALARLEREGLLDAVITQNIDGLHARAGTRELIEVHGSIAQSSCPGCGRRYPLREVRSRQSSDPRGVPACDCGAALKPDVVLFGEHLPVSVLDRAERLAADAELMLCIGSSLGVYPVAELPAMTLARGGRVAVITKGSTPFDGRAAARMHADVVAALESVLRELALSPEQRSEPEARLRSAQA
ncbi:MAG: NAD-dependent deacylase [Actinomycetota bacterium]|nr:NAD-dependent deacylase [Actinomycetota bacterium]